MMLWIVEAEKEGAPWEIFRSNNRQWPVAACKYTTGQADLVQGCMENMR